MHCARQLIAAKNADRERSQAVAQARIARRAAALDAADVAAGIATSEADPGLRDLLAEFADVPAFIADAADPEIEADAEIDDAWLNKIARVGVWQDVIQRVRTDITAAMITSILRMAAGAGLHAQSHRRAVRIRNILSRLARDILSALILARMRVIHICISARIQRAGRAAALASAGPAHYC